MTIQTKYSVDDTVWFAYPSGLLEGPAFGAASGVVCGLSIRVDSPNDIDTIYLIRIGNEPFLANLLEVALFSTKEEVEDKLSIALP